MLESTVATPAALVDLDRIEANATRMSERVARLGAKLRPHVKTHKTVEGARLQVRGHFGGITVSTLAEAHRYAEAGFRDITYAVPIAIPRLPEVAELSRSVEALHLLVDHEATLGEVESCAKAKEVVLSAYLKVDCGYHRAGVDPEKEESLRIARRMNDSPHVSFRGILTHAGHAYACKGREEIRRVAEQERSVMEKFANKLARAGAAPPEVSVGSTPTMALAESLEGVTEVRPGNYVFFDRFQSTVGSCTVDDVAFSVLATVLSHYPERGEILVDAGALALSKDEGPTHMEPECGYGAVTDISGQRALEHLRVFSLSQEHGKIAGARAADFAALPVGARLRIVPNHSCLSAALFDRYHVHRDGKLVDEWRPVRGW
jgi:D-serine deaminase-like pyridoxal phosphate-dependent protein